MANYSITIIYWFKPLGLQLYFAMCQCIEFYLPKLIVPIESVQTEGKYNKCLHCTFAEGIRFLKFISVYPYNKLRNKQSKNYYEREREAGNCLKSDNQRQSQANG